MDDFKAIDGPYRVEADLNLHGTISGQLTIAAGFEVAVYGIVTGDLIAQEDSLVRIHGTVEGLVRNRGGRIEVFGSIGGIEEAIGVVVIDKAARIQARNQKAK